jgi:hypothetical protein
MKTAMMGLSAGLLLTSCWRSAGLGDDDRDGSPNSDSIDTAGGDADGDADGDTDTDSTSDSGGDTDELRCVTGDNCTAAFCDHVFLPSGTYPRGSSGPDEVPFVVEACVKYEFGDETPEHDVYLDAFCIDKYEVSWERYYDCVEAGACDPGEADPDNVATSRRPVLSASYGKAADYCEWIGRRMCTEAEWERAANGPGPEKRLHPWGEAPIAPGSRGFYGGDPVGVFVEVNEGAEYASVEGVYNLVGNALELVADYYEPYDPPDGGPLENPVGPAGGEFRIARGGCAGFPSNYTTSERVIIDADHADDDYSEW